MTDPFQLFNEWYEQTVASGAKEPYAFVLSTVNTAGEPRSRVVLWRRLVNNVFYFFTNYSSDKSLEIGAKNRVAMNFHWREPFHRQVRIQGRIQKASASISDEYFSTRPRGSQIGAWASPQSRVITNRFELEQKVNEVEEAFKDRPVTRPEFWGGFGIEPDYIEFWQEGESRLHQRTVYELVDKKWQLKTLAP